jgi:DNA-binding transcriptional regulator YdaS (Cro superfamily)
MARHGIQLAIKAAGSKAALARIIDRSPQIVAFWAKKNRLPAEYVRVIERATGIPRHKLRPDIYS